MESQYLGDRDRKIRSSRPAWDTRNSNKTKPTKTNIREKEAQWVKVQWEAQWVKVPAAKPDNLTLIPRI